MHSPSMPGTWLRSAAALLVWVCLLACPTAGARADEDVAKFLVSQAKKAISKRKFDEAIAKLERARTEAPDLAEAAYLLGTVYDKKKDAPGALAAYRDFRDICERLGSKLSSRDKRYLKKAEKRLEKLGSGGDALDAALDLFARRLTTLAMAWKDKDPDLARDAVRRVLAVRPKHKPAQDLLDAMNGAEALADTDDATPEGPPSPIPGIKTWRDLLKHRDIPPDNERQYKRKILTLDQEDGSIFWTNGPVRAPKRFVYDMEYRVLESHRPGELIGFAFAQDEAKEEAGGMDVVMAFAQRSTLNLVHATGNNNKDIGEVTSDAKPYGIWRRLTIAVEGRKVYVYLDGKKLLSSSVSGRKSLEGPIGLFHQRCRCEIRMLRLGTK